ncbi:MAG: winged helix-turn-helix domain-containing protein [Culicoidibacterales bacterium]
MSKNKIVIVNNEMELLINIANTLINKKIQMNLIGGSKIDRSELEENQKLVFTNSVAFGLDIVVEIIELMQIKNIFIVSTIEEAVTRTENILRRNNLFDNVLFVIKPEESKVEARDKNLVSISETIEVDCKKKKAFKNGEYIHLTNKEYQLLSLFLGNKNKVISRKDILSKIWGKSEEGNDRKVDTFVKILRKKMDIISIKTLHGVGYEWVEQE